MKKEIIICIVIIVLIIITNIISQNFTKECVEYITNNLYKLEEMLLEGNTNDFYQKINDIDEKWHEFQGVLAFYIEHDELEKVETKIANIKGLEKTSNYEEMLPQIEESIFLLEHIRDKHVLTARNIF